MIKNNNSVRCCPMNNKGIEFSIGMIVILILSILIFSISVYLLFKWFGEVDVLSDEIDRRTRDEISASLKTGSLVTVPFPVQIVKKSQSAIFGIGVKNPGPAKTFSMAASFSKAYYPDGKLMTVDKDFIEAWLGSFAQAEPFLINGNSDAVKPLLIRTSSSNVVNGDYVFNVCVFHQDPVPCTVSSYRADPGKFYSERIYQVTVRIK